MAGIPLRLLVAPGQAYDNRARLSSLARRASPPRVVIAHGDHDTLIPDRMGKALAQVVPGTRFLSVHGAGHNDAVLALPDALALALEPPR
jgi:hypothetical protein